MKKPHATRPAFLSVTQTANALNCSVQTVRRLCARGTLPFLLVGPLNSRLISTEAVEQLARERSESRAAPL